MDAMMEVDISKEDRERLVRIFSADVTFLAEQELMDYSLLLGIYRRPEGEGRDGLGLPSINCVTMRVDVDWDLLTTSILHVRTVRGSA